ncbi:unnamed protein product [Closterium sp. Naga37s-1]|nr:unnamed protein product [Closterium sp. Naga37s-1]
MHIAIALPALSGAAKLTIIGNCTATRCIISGGGAFPIFTSPSSGPTGGELTLVNLNFQRAAGGVLFNVWAAINASQCGFVGSTAPSVGGGVLSDSFPESATAPNRFFSYCTFYNNTAPTGGGGAISINVGNPEGSINVGNPESSGPNVTFVYCIFQNNTATLAKGGAVSINLGDPQGSAANVTFVHCRFRNNSAYQASGGAITVAGTGDIRCTKCSFEGNFAGLHGGGIYSDGASLTLSQPTFKRNRAVGPFNARCGLGGAVFAIPGRRIQVSLRFCKAFFLLNRGCIRKVADLALAVPSRDSEFSGTLMFCGGVKTLGSIFLPPHSTCA